MNIAYFGSPIISQWLLEYLTRHSIDISIVITQPDMPAGKRLKMTPTAVKKFALEHNISIFDKPLSSDSEAELIHSLQEKQIDLGVLFAYGEILSPKVLTCMKYGIWNVHPSLLPKYRGPAPIIFPLILGESTTGTTLIQMSKELDQGNILQQDILSITKQDDRDAIEHKLVDLASKQVINALALLKTGTLQSKQQVAQFATYTKILKKKDGLLTQKFISQALNNEKITFENLPELIKMYYRRNNITPQKTYNAGQILFNLYQGLHPWPGIWTLVKIGEYEKRLKILQVSIENSIPQIETVQLEGKKPVNFQAFLKAYNFTF